MKRFVRCIFPVISALAVNAHAHFPFIVPMQDDLGRARVVFSETLEPDDKVPVASLADYKLVSRSDDGKETPITTTPATHWLDATLPASSKVIYGIADLGRMQRGKGLPHLLIYHPKTVVGDPFEPSVRIGTAPVELVPVRVEGGFKMKLEAQGVSVGEKKIMVIHPDGIEEEFDLDSEGFSPLLTQPGRYGAWARHWLDKQGQRDGKEYVQERHYATIVFDYAKAKPSTQPAALSPDAASVAAAPFRLPQTLASFGAVELDGYLYVFGGHVIDRHEYHTKAVTGAFRRIKLGGSTTWEDLPGSAMGMQGMNLAAYKGKIYRLGGMQPRNAPGEATDNVSLAELTCFDPATKQWTTLTPPPHARSSHDLAIVGGKLYVVGGWEMKGKDVDNVWLSKTDVLDLDDPSAGWTSIDQPWVRRALIVASAGSRIYAIGGMDEHDTVAKRVDILDTQIGQWSSGPEIPGSSRNGFAPAACVLDGRVYVSLPAGELYRLNAQQTDWELLAKTTPRQVHRMVPCNGRLYVVGGAMGERMTDLVEIVTLGNGLSSNQAQNGSPDVPQTADAATSE